MSKRKRLELTLNIKGNVGRFNSPMDLDIICVFKNDTSCFENFRTNLNTDERNILTHGIFGVEEKDLVQAMSYNLISNLKFSPSKK